MADWMMVERELAAALTSARRLANGITGTLDGCEVRAERVRGIAEEWLVMCAPICKSDEIDPMLALERNARLAFATIAVAEGKYWLRVAVPLDSNEVADGRRLVALMVEATRSLSPRLVGTSTTNAFDHFAT